MRPIERGPVPQVNGKDKQVKDYGNWRADLLDRFGEYCCYCNDKLPERAQVEHVVAQAQGGNKLAWVNLVLACGACNSRKNAQLCDSTTHFLPDVHDTHLAFTHQIVPHPRKNSRYQQAAIVIVRPGLTPAQAVKAQATINLCGLGLAGIPTDKRRTEQAIDWRWKHRFKQMELAGIWRSKWDLADSIGQGLLLGCISALVEAAGFFSVWFEAFHDVPVVKQALVNAFPNTAACFPAPSFDPVVRIAGDL